MEGQKIWINTLLIYLQRIVDGRIVFSEVYLCSLPRKVFLCTFIGIKAWIWAVLGSAFYSQRQYLDRWRLHKFAFFREINYVHIKGVIV